MTAPEPPAPSASSSEFDSRTVTSESSAPAVSSAPGGSPTAVAIFAGGCFWCTEAVFEQLDGVLDVTSGYIGGDPSRADYRSVCTGMTGHAEAIRIEFDPSRIGYDQLLDVFFDAHDPTQLNRQGNDVGTQYRSAVFFADDAERQSVEAKIAALNSSGKFQRPIVTRLEPRSQFFPAEPYHQDYARLNPYQPYIQAVSLPKVCKIREKHKGLIRE